MENEEIEVAGLSVAELDVLLLRPCLSLEQRAALMTARITLDQAQRATPPRIEPPTGFTVNIPDNLGISDIIDQAGRKFQARSSIDGRRVIDIMPSTFRALLQGPHGLDWSNANQGGDVWQKMQPGIHVN